MPSEFKAIYVIERDVNDDLFTWAFPSLTFVPEEICKARCGLFTSSPASPVNPDFIDKPFFSVYQSKWLYFLTRLLPEPNGYVTAYSIVIISENYNIPQYFTLLPLLAKQYETEKSTKPLYLSFVGAALSGRATIAGTKWVASSFDQRNSLVAPVTKLIQSLGIESVLLFVASLTKQKVLVYHPNPVEVGNAVRSIACLGSWHREPWTNIRPLICPTEETSELDLNDISSSFIVGTTSETYNTITPWDIYVDLQSLAITVADHARSKFMMGKYHKGIADGLVQLASVEDTDDQQSDSRIIKFCISKVKELTQQLKSLSSQADQLTLEDIKSKNLPPAMEVFLQLTAEAESLLSSA